jgi:hypothetical protein
MAIQVIHGANEGFFELQNRTVGGVRKALRDTFNIPEEADSHLTGEIVTDIRVVGDADLIEFSKPFGAKGLGALLTPEELQDKWQINGDEYEELLILGLPVVRFQSGSVRHSELAVDEFMCQRAIQKRPEQSQDSIAERMVIAIELVAAHLPKLEDQARKAAQSDLRNDETLVTHVRRIADHFDPPPPDIVGTGYVAQKLNCTTIWITEMIRLGQIPRNCVLPGTGNGKPWKFYRTRIDQWISSR